MRQPAPPRSPARARLRIGAIVGHQRRRFVTVLRGRLPTCDLRLFGLVPGGGRSGGRQREPPSLAIVTCIKNEGEDLVEWLCFHRLIGVSRFVIYDNLSTDATLRILDAVPFRDEIVVHTRRRRIGAEGRFPRRDQALPRRARLGGVHRRRRVHRAARRDVRCSTSWPSSRRRGVDGFGIHWRIFGSSGHEVRPQGLVTASLHAAGDGRFSRRTGT